MKRLFQQEEQQQLQTMDDLIRKAYSGELKKNKIANICIRNFILNDMKFKF